MARQKIRQLLLMRKRSAMFQRVGQRTYALANRLMDETLFGAPRFVRGWTAKADCEAAVDAFTVRFSTAVDWESNGFSGVSFSKTGDNPQTIYPTAAATPGNIDIQYAISWTVAPVAGDVVTMDYTLGTYFKAGSTFADDPMDPFGPSDMINCADPQSNVGIVESWTGLPDCLSAGEPQLLSARLINNSTIEATFDRPLTFTDHTGVVFRNRTIADIAEPISGPLYTTNEGDGTSVLTYNNVNWHTTPQPGDDLRMTYGVEVRLLDNFNQTPLALLPSYMPEIGPQWVKLDFDHQINSAGNSAVGAEGSYQTNFIDGQEDGLSVFTNFRRLNNNSDGTMGIIIRSLASASVNSNDDAAWIGLEVDSNGVATLIKLGPWWQSPDIPYDIANNPFPDIDFFTVGGVEMVFNDLGGDNGIKVTAQAGSLSSSVVLTGALNPLPPVTPAHTWVGVVTEGGTLRDERVYGNFTVYKHPVGNYADMAGTFITDVQAVDLT